MTPPLGRKYGVLPLGLARVKDKVHLYNLKRNMINIVENNKKVNGHFAIYTGIRSLLILTWTGAW